MEDVVSRNRVIVNVNASSCGVRDVLKPQIVPCKNVVEGIGKLAGTSVLNMPGDAAGIRL